MNDVDGDEPDVPWPRRKTARLTPRQRWTAWGVGQVIGIAIGAFAVLTIIARFI